MRLKPISADVGNLPNLIIYHVSLSKIRIKLLVAYVAISAIVIGGAFALAIFARASSDSFIFTIIAGSNWISGGISSGSTGAIGLITALFAGVVVAFNPCGFVLLPAYVSIYLSDNSAEAKASSNKVYRRILRALLVSLLMGSGFVLMFAAFGLLVGLVSSAIAFADIFAWIGLILGIIMVLLGVYIVLGGKAYAALPQRLAGRVSGSGKVGLAGYFLFGLSYALASLSCSLPIFISITTLALQSGGILQAVITFIAYAVGMTLVITVITLLIAILKSSVLKYITKIPSIVNAVSAVIITLIGFYLVLYWVAVGNLFGTAA